LQIGRIKDAIEIFELNIEQFPNSYNVYDSMGEAYMLDKNKKLAIKNYEKSLKLNPENKNAEEMIKKLKEK
jgi:tetratricopeptide (TPR) repeat protein